jgi:peptide/nickel transport system permease protein
MILPAFALGVAAMAGTARLLRSSLLEVMQSNFVRTVKARGAAPTTVLLKHATRNSILPVFTVLGLQVGTILGGTVILESIFSIPGMGLMIFRAVQVRDYPVVLGCVVVYAVVFVFVNIVVDLMYGLIDPRVRYR